MLFLLWAECALVRSLCLSVCLRQSDRQTKSTIYFFSVSKIEIVNLIHYYILREHYACWPC